MPDVVSTIEGVRAAPLLDRACTRALDAALVERGVPSLVLMENAGRGAADAIARGLRVRGVRGVARVLVLAGPGNNGGDGFVVARHLARRGHRVTVLALSPLEKYLGDAAAMARAWLAAGGTLERLGEGAWPARCDVAVDALFGTGLTRALQGPAAEAVQRANALERGWRVALDVPSGLDVETGAALGDEQGVFRAALTITFATGKAGLYTGFGRRVAGTVVVAHLGVGLGDAVLAQARCFRVLRASLAPRDEFGHKGTHGRVVLVGGSDGITGAALLAARGAHRLGAGLVTIASRARSIEARVLESMCRLLPTEVDAVPAALDALAGAESVWVVGPGLGRDDWARAVVDHVWRATGTVLFDGDALALLPEVVAGGTVSAGPRTVVLTPHPLEAARLLGHTRVAEVERDRLLAARTIAARYGALVVLKGPGTVIAEPSGRCHLLDRADARLGVGGSGDVLAGALGAALAERGAVPLRAVVAAALAHACSLGPSVGAGGRGVLARQLADGLPRGLERAAGRRLER